MSYSLTYHLAETGSECLQDGYIYAAFDYDAFAARLNASKGRIDTLDSVDQLLALCHAYVGTYLSSHSALLRLSSPSVKLNNLLETTMGAFKLREIGTARREPLLALARSIAEQARQQSLVPGYSNLAVEHISLWLFAIVTTCGLADFEQERLLLIRSAVKHGFDYIAHLEDTDANYGELLLALGEIVREEVKYSLLLDLPSSISPSQYRSLLGIQPPLIFPTLPSDISFVFSGPPEPPEIRELAFDFQKRWGTFAHFLYRHLEFVLAFTPSSSLLTAVEYCWDRISKLLNLFRRAIEAILSDFRFTPNDLKLRPRVCLSNLTYDEAVSMTTLRSCHNALARIPNSLHLQAKSNQLWFDALSRSASRLRLVPICRRSGFDLISSSSKFVNCLRLCPPHTLFRWANLFPEHCKDLIESLRLATFGIPEACQFIRHLEEASSN